MGRASRILRISELTSAGFGDWLRLGSPNAWTRDEQFKLARIRLDITNETDSEWHLDVKKSTARPPVAIRDRLTQLGGEVRRMAREVFAASRSLWSACASPQEIQRPWISRLRNGHRVYSINRSHPMVSGVFIVVPKCGLKSRRYCVSSKRQYPVQQIWLDTLNRPTTMPSAYDGVDNADIRADMRSLFELLNEIRNQLADRAASACGRLNRLIVTRNLIKEL